MRHDEAVAEIERCSGTQFDPDCVRALLEVVRAEGWADAEREHVVQPPDAQG
jgi:HD-GYP domain-containing protein (c-di-GMP phosphodiesterase class II)